MIVCVSHLLLVWCLNIFDAQLLRLYVTNSGKVGNIDKGRGQAINVGIEDGIIGGMERVLGIW